MQQISFGSSAHPTGHQASLGERHRFLFGNDEKPICYDGEAEFGIYKDERIQHVYEQNAISLLSQIIGRAGLNRFSNKTIVLLTSLSLPNITDQPDTSLFDWEDFEVAGGLDKLPETIATREQFEIERDNLTAESSREKVEQVLGGLQKPSKPDIDEI